MNQKYKDEVDSSSLSKDVLDIASEYAEIGIDNILSGEITKDIPIVSSIMGLYKLGNSIRDKIFVKKVISFLDPIRNTSVEERNKWLLSIELNDNIGVKVGETLALVLNASNSYQQSEMIGKIYCACIKGQITYQELQKLSAIVTRSFIPTLTKIKLFEIENLEDFIIEELASYGLITLKLEDNKDHMSWSEKGRRKGFSENSKSETFNQRIIYKTTEVGRLFKDYIIA